MDAGVEEFEGGGNKADTEAITKFGIILFCKEKRNVCNRCLLNISQDLYVIGESF